MSFTTASFLFFFLPITIVLFLFVSFLEEKFDLIKRKELKKYFLVIASILFYSFAGIYDVISLMIYSMVTFACGTLLIKSKKNKKLLCFIVPVVLLIPLIYSKYFLFVFNLIGTIFKLEVTEPHIFTFVGISFITFSALSYIFDIYYEKVDEEKNKFLDFLLYITFFPKIISGPIVKWRDFNLSTEKRNLRDDFIVGINKISIGIFKKVLIADTLGNVVVSIGKQGLNIDIVTAWGCTFLYFLQIYYDFAGYSDIAIGLLKILGFDCDENFNFPYKSTSISEFWRRWHISLGSWFREYIYIPLGGNRAGEKRTLINLFIVFIVTGIWHGAGFGYLIWGISHGLCVIFERTQRDKLWYKKMPKFLKWIGTMFIVMLGWQFFRYGDIMDTFYFFKSLFVSNHNFIDYTYKYFFDRKTVVIALIGFVFSVFGERSLNSLKKEIDENRLIPFILIETSVIIILVFSLISMVSSTVSPFIYFQY